MSSTAKLELVPTSEIKQYTICSQMTALLGNFFRVIETVYIFTGMIVQMYTPVKTFPTIHLKRMHFILSKLYLTKLMWKVKQRDKRECTPESDCVNSNPHFASCYVENCTNYLTPLCPKFPHLQNRTTNRIQLKRAVLRVIKVLKR